MIVNGESVPEAVLSAAVATGEAVAAVEPAGEASSVPVDATDAALEDATEEAVSEAILPTSVEVNGEPVGVTFDGSVALVDGHPVVATPEGSSVVIDGEEVPVTFEGDEVIVNVNMLE